MENKRGRYNIVRFFSKQGRRAKLVKSGVNRDFAVAWCSHENTRKAGKWFDGFTDRIMDDKKPLFADYEYNKISDLDYLK